MKHPDREVGPPPTKQAVAGRMNAAGISVFYGATAPSVALAEARPPVGSKVLVACFEIIRPLKLLDLVAMTDISDEPGSLFDDAHRRCLKQAQFLRGLTVRLSRPVMRDDQILDYLPTQAIADFLAAEATPPLDGIIYPSVQADHETPPVERGLLGIRRARVNARLGAGYHCNVALFQKAARVECLDNGRDVSVADDSDLYSFSDTADGGPYVRYTAWVAHTEDQVLIVRSSLRGGSQLQNAIEFGWSIPCSFVVGGEETECPPCR
jgi:hypothetical protein